MELCYVSFFSLFSVVLSKCPAMSKNKGCKKKERGDENRGKGRVSCFHPFNNRGMSCAYPLIITLLYSFPPSSVISHSPQPAFDGGEPFPHSGRPFFVTPPSLCPSLPHTLSDSSRHTLVLCFKLRFFQRSTQNLKLGGSNGVNISKFRKMWPFFYHFEQSASILRGCRFKNLLKVS